MNGRVGAEPAGLVSFDVFYAAELSYLLALAVALLTSREAARDIVQETLLRAYRDWPRVSRPDRHGDQVVVHGPADAGSPVAGRGGWQ
ncbi:MAG: hypothetical protein JWN62_493 [Acidimicrobiales bacterium]|nr:hypothetical protein [Acidimicrobiales bacterium]